MSKVVIIYGSAEGQTARIADHIASRLRERAHTVEVHAARGLPPGFTLEAFDGVIVGASVHYGRHQPYVREWVTKARDTLQNRHSAFYSVSLVACDPSPESQAQAKGLIDRFVAQTGWTPHQSASFAGAVMFSRYGFVRRLIMKMVMRRSGMKVDAAHDHEYTNWEAVDRFAAAFARELEAR